MNRQLRIRIARKHRHQPIHRPGRRRLPHPGLPGRLQPPRVLGRHPQLPLPNSDQHREALHVVRCQAQQIDQRDPRHQLRDPGLSRHRCPVPGPRRPPRPFPSPTTAATRARLIVEFLRHHPSSSRSQRA